MAGGSWASFGLFNNPDADYYPEAAQAPRSLSLRNAKLVKPRGLIVVDRIPISHRRVDGPIPIKIPPNLCPSLAASSTDEERLDIG
jgi:hypothetical protein